MRGLDAGLSISVPDLGGSSGGSGSVDDGRHNSVSIGDRIEGIRACLEARMGTQRFQKLYRSLSSLDTTAVSSAASVGLGCCDAGSGASPSWPRDSSMVLPEEIDEVFDGAGEGGSADLDSLAPLVAKLVACEHSYFS